MKRTSLSHEASNLPGCFPMLVLSGTEKGITASSRVLTTIGMTCAISSLYLVTARCF